MESKRVRSYVERALEEVTAALVTYTNGAESEWFAYSASALKRISNSALADPIGRVASDVPRKIRRSDRLVGPLLLVLRTSFHLSAALTTSLVHALYYARLYDSAFEDYENDLETKNLSQQLEKKGVRFVLKDVCGLMDSDPTESMVISRIEREYSKTFNP